MSQSSGIWKAGSPIYIAGLMTVLLIVLALTHLAHGAHDISLHDVWSSLSGDFNRTGDKTTHTIIWSIRLPRLLTAIIVGSSLAVSGAALQGLFRNPLADPYVLGIASGGAFGAALAMLLTTQLIFGATTGAFLGAGLAGVMVLGLAHDGASYRLNSILLAGVAVGLIFSALLSLVLLFAERQAGDMLSWLLGHVGHTSWSQLTVMAALTFVGIIAIQSCASALDVALLGENAAQGIGVQFSSLKKTVLLATFILVASAVAYCGIIGFVGLVVPHTMRLLAGPSHKYLIGLSALGGAILLVAADLVARLILPERELPVGVITALIGGPFFLFLLRKDGQHVGH